MQKEKLRWLASEINRLKVGFMQVLSRERSEHGKMTEAARTALRDLTASCLSLYQWSKPLGSSLPPTDNQPGDQALLLAVSALQTLQTFEPSQKRQIQAIVVLEALLDRSEHNHEAKLILIRLYHELGLDRLAFRWYSTLGTKETLHDTLSYIMYTRISTAHPFSFSKGSDLSEEISKIMEFYLRSERTIAGCMLEAFEQGSYDQIWKFWELQDRMSLSFTKPLILLEKHRMARIRGTAIEEREATALRKLVARSDMLYDNRDSTTGFDCQSSRFKNDLQPTLPAMPGKKWLEITHEWHRTSEAIVAGILDQGSSSIDKHSDWAQLSNPEAHVAPLWAAIHRCNQLPRISTLVDELRALSDGLKGYRKEHIPESDQVRRNFLANPLPSKDILQKFFLTFEVLRACVAFSNNMLDSSKRKTAGLSAQPSKSDKEALNQLKGLVDEVHQAIRRLTLEHTNLLSEKGASALASQILGDAESGDVVDHGLAEVIDANWIKYSVVPAMLASAQDAFDGTLRVKLK